MDKLERSPARLVAHPNAPSASDARFVEVALTRLAKTSGDDLAEIKRAYEAARTLPPNLRNNTSHVRGYTVEALGREELARRFPGHHVDFGVEIRKGATDNVLGELDAIVIRDKDGQVAAMAEAKASPERMAGGLSKVRAHLARIQGSEVDHYQTRGEKKVWSFDDPEGPHHRSTFSKLGAGQCFAIGPSDAPERADYIRLPISQASLGTIAELIVAQSREARTNVAQPLAA
ncbi:MAG: hypothetical protein HYV07_02405 [Deltaproteobacteria bacterium]|nr:hypothetical protein [Deltaproteobacteria bacterium]